MSETFLFPLMIGLLMSTLLSRLIRLIELANLVYHPPSSLSKTKQNKIQTSMKTSEVKPEKLFL